MNNEICLKSPGTRMHERRIMLRDTFVQYSIELNELRDCPGDTTVEENEVHDLMRGVVAWMNRIDKHPAYIEYDNTVKLSIPPAELLED